MNALTKEVFSAVYNNTRVPDASYLQKIHLFNAAMLATRFVALHSAACKKKMRRTGTLHLRTLDLQRQVLTTKLKSSGMIVWTGDIDSVHDNVVTPPSFVRESIKVRNQVSLKPCVCRFPNQSINTLMPSEKKRATIRAIKR
jgi:hypothetical protein